MIKKLLANGHQVKIMAIFELPCGAKEDGFDTHRVDWHRFEFERIEHFNPDRIVVFNGFFRPIHAATKTLSRKFSVLLAEVAWFPQNDYIYIDRGIHHNSDIAKTVEKAVGYRNEEELFKREHLLKELAEEYAPGEKPPEFEEGVPNITVPLQLERDTSILYASPYFKDMGSLVGFIVNALSGIQVNIIVKSHPKLNTDELEEKFDPAKYPGIKFVKETEYTMNDYAFYSDAVVGINSTALMEAKLHGKPVFQMGRNIFKRACEAPDKDRLRFFMDDIIDGMEVVDPIETKIALLTMMANQIDFRNPPQWAIDKILSDPKDAGITRTMKDINV